jgi:DNA-binding transcriptional ArsR family regulator
MASREEITRLADELQSSRALLSALGDEVRQHLILVMMQSGDCSGLRVNEIAEKTSLSRPAVSHHLQILKSVGILKMRREGTKNYYYFDENTEAVDRLITMLEHAKKIMGSLPDRSGEND